MGGGWTLAEAERPVPRSLPHAGVVPWRPDWGGLGPGLTMPGVWHATTHMALETIQTM